MSSEINTLSGLPLHNAGEGSQVNQNGSRPSRETGMTMEAKDDQVSLTNSATRLRALENEVSQLPAVDSKRVAEVQRAIANGSLQINPSQVAETMLSSERAMA